MGSVVGALKCTICGKNGQDLLDANIKGMVHLLGAGYNLFNLTKQLDQGWSLGGIVKRYDCRKGAIYTIYLRRKVASSEEMVMMGTERSKPIHCKLAHTLMGHVYEADSCKSI
eukprot:11982629-Ditylum_brightwellii.AAC.2